MEQESMHVGFALKRLDNELHRRITADRAAAGGGELTMMHRWILRYLYDRPDEDVFQKNIEAHFSIARSTATGMLQLMEKNGYLTRVGVDWDARLKKLVLTQKGIDVEETTRKSIIRMEDLLIEGLSKEDLDLFFRIIEKMRANIASDQNETDRRRS